MRRVCLVATSSLVLAASGGAQPPITKDDQPKSAQQTSSGHLRKYGDLNDNVAEGAGVGAEPQEVEAYPYLKDAVDVYHKMESAGLADARSSLNKGEPAGESFEKYMPQGLKEERTNAAKDEGTTAKQGPDDAWKGQKTGSKVEGEEIGQSKRVEKDAQHTEDAFSKIGWSAAVQGEKIADTFSTPGRDYAAKAGAAEDSFEKLGWTYADRAGKTTQTFEKEGSGFDKKASPSASSKSASTERGAKDIQIEKSSADVNMLLSLPDFTEYGAGAYLKDAGKIYHKMENAGLADARTSLEKGEPAGESLEKYVPPAWSEKKTKAAQGSDDVRESQKTGAELEKEEIGGSLQVTGEARKTEDAFSQLGLRAADEGEKMSGIFSTPGKEQPGAGSGADYATSAGKAQNVFTKFGSTYADEAGKMADTFEKEGSSFYHKAVKEEATTATAKKPAGEQGAVEKAAKNAAMDKAATEDTSAERVTAEEAVEKNVEEKDPAEVSTAERAGDKKVEPSASKEPVDEAGATEMATVKLAVNEEDAAQALKVKIEARKTAKEKASVPGAAAEEPAEEPEEEAAVEKVPAEDAVEKEARQVEKPSADVKELKSSKRGKEDKQHSSAAESSKLSSWKAGKMPLASCASVTVLGVLASLLAFFNRRRSHFEDIGECYVQV